MTIHYICYISGKQVEPKMIRYRTQVRILNQILSTSIGPTFYYRVVIFYTQKKFPCLTMCNLKFCWLINRNFRSVILIEKSGTVSVVAVTNKKFAKILQSLLLCQGWNTVTQDKALLDFNQVRKSKLLGLWIAGVQ